MTDPAALNFGPLVLSLLQQARAARQRRVLVFAGSRAWGQAAACEAITAGALTDTLWISDAPPAGARALHGAHARHLLGSEVDAVVFDGFAGLDVEAFGAVVGAVRAGGLLLLLMPPRRHVVAFPDPEQARITVHPVAPSQVSTRFLQRFLRELAAADGVTWLEQDDVLPVPLPAPSSVAAAPRPDASGCLTADQRRAYDAIVALATTPANAHGALVMTSDRGRGKSAALGLAAATLLRAGVSRIVVTAPRFDAAAMVFTHAQQHLPAAQRGRDVVRYRDARLQFVPPDAVAACEPCALLLVDEAAAIPVPLLERMLAAHAPIVFATTVHGYEGSGRGFATRFQALLAAHRPGWHALRLEQPVRWAEADPLERLAFRALLLNGSPVDDVAAVQAWQAGYTVERIDRDRLLADDTLLGQLFGLLVLAHYRTSPLDLRFLLDGPNLSVWLARHGQQVIGAALVAAEGDFDRALARAVWQGTRRPRGHLLVQSLAVHAGFEEAPALRFLRIVRLAVHPAVQGHGIGGALVEAICAAAQGEADAVGSSFGASPALVRFWEQRGFHPVRLGVTREAASGAPALMVLRPLSSAGVALCQEAHARYADALPHLLVDPLRDLDDALAAALRLSVHAAPPSDALGALDERDWRELAMYVAGRRDIELVLGSLQRLVDAKMLEELTPAARALVQAKLHAHRSWAELADAFHLHGRKAAASALREVLAPLITARGGTVVREALDQLVEAARD